MKSKTMDPVDKCQVCGATSRGQLRVEYNGSAIAVRVVCVDCLAVFIDTASSSLRSRTDRSVACLEVV